MKMLDPEAFAQWVSGVESRLEVAHGPRHLIWTRESQPQWDGVRFGEGKQPGVRHLPHRLDAAVEDRGRARPRRRAA